MKYPETSKRLTFALSRAHIEKAQELADKSGVSKASISQYINGTHAPGTFNAAKIGQVLGVNPVWLMGFDVPMIAEEDNAKENENTVIFVEYFNKLNEDGQKRLMQYMIDLLDTGKYKR